MRAKIIVQAAFKVANEGISDHPHIMISLMGSFEELAHQAKIVKTVAQDVIDNSGKKYVLLLTPMVASKYKMGTMIEVPRGTLAKVAEFFSFNTNDLTQVTFSTLLHESRWAGKRISSRFSTLRAKMS
ncbi:hypothetical protein PHYBOEH_008852 [Phytophthora boehmeriae]|uniref:PEP-utilising enzyme C-terminal domain-containing protein n=1 Tax=Phytophthora boehmeriae TaxID=109152 RepID=A0A8T1X7K4_9STRA|nr:hypothetical protein PHYBOEH_008852 [Phytophthora boehmeriae]